jgi:hypothetical protein
VRRRRRDRPPRCARRPGCGCPAPGPSGPSSRRSGPRARRCRRWRKAVTGRLDLTTTEHVQLVPKRGVVGDQQCRHASSPIRSSVVVDRRVGEHHRRERPLACLGEGGLHGPAGRTPIERHPGAHRRGPICRGPAGPRRWCRARCRASRHRPSRPGRHRTSCSRRGASGTSSCH